MTGFDATMILMAALGSLAFGVLFNVHGKKLLAITLGGAVSWLFVIFFGYLGVDEATSYFLVALLVSLYAETLARLLKAPTTVFIIPSLIPLIPGSSLYYSMAYALGGERELFADKAISTLKLAAALAVGIVVATVLTQLFLKIWQYFSTRKGNKAP